MINLPKNVFPAVDKLSHDNTEDPQLDVAIAKAEQCLKSIEDNTSDDDIKQKIKVDKKGRKVSFETTTAKNRYNFAIELKDDEPAEEGEMDISVEPKDKVKKLPKRKFNDEDWDKVRADIVRNEIEG